MIRMPLKLKWGKKSGRYELSQDVYVLSIFIGEHLILQCTLTTESPAQQCIEYLRQKVDLNQVDMFGLRYQMRCNDPDQRIMRWVEMDKALRKQLDKWACKPRQVQLAILFHTPNAFTLTDQMARSYYFLMMKLDVVEGRLTLEMEKYINLAALSLQVEYGDYDATIHTTDFMRSLQLLPTSICRSAQIMEDLLKRVSQVHERLSGMQPSYAALLYIVDTQQSEGYGEEFFNARDEDSSEVSIGYSIEGGIIVKRSYAAPLKYAWNDIKEIYGSKRHFYVKCKDSTIVEFTLEDAEMVRYLVVLFNWQFKYATTEAIVHRNVPMDINNLQGSIKTFSATPFHKVPTNESFQMPSARTLSCSSTRTDSVASSQYFLPTGPASSLFNINSVLDSGRPAAPPMLSSLSFRTPLSTSTTVDRARAASVVGSILPSESVLLHHSTVHPLLRDVPRNGIYRPGAPHQPLMTPNPEIISALTSHMTPPKRQFLKAKIGSSPEIHMVGATQKATQKATRMRAEMMQRTPRSNPDLSSKWRSTPDLQSMARESFGHHLRASDIPSRVSASPAPLYYSTGHVISDCGNVEIVYPLPALLESSSSLSATPGAQVTNPPNLLPIVPPPSGGAASNHVTSLLVFDDENDVNRNHDMRHAVGVALVDGVFVAQNGTLPGRNSCSGDHMLRTILRKLSSDELFLEFSAIPRKRHSAGCSTSQLPENQRRNRDRNVVPYEDTRVILHSLKKNTTGYINASNVQVALGKTILRYVVTQAPLQETIDDFWQMVLESGAEVIVALYEPHAGNHSAVPFFWPTTSRGKLLTNDFSVKLSTVTVGKHQTTTILTLKSSGERRRTVYLLNYACKDGMPHDEESFCGFIDAVNSVRRHVCNERILESDSGISSAISSSRSRSRSASRANLSDVTNRGRSHSSDGSWKRRLQLSSGGISLQSDASSECSSSASGVTPPISPNPEPPLLVVCQDGTRDSGLYLLIDVVIHCFENSIDVDIPKTLNLLRSQRMNLLQSFEQYRFAYSLIAKYLQKSRLI
ncbi:hypothetical protein QR680_005580 [Steinernema hermaphroditum]|uniref:protein-tyrosine-phosphatase n=1 Tax=Steinernema hermaphroditum TaxID=289476 RepID=A0AA39HTV0_9BILA|nr:hypothetical protein QR680_005580 [Steinernema hermaphroditum]